MVAALADPDRGWDAIVIGEYERAFYGSQYASIAPLFTHYGIALWTPEAGGPVGNSEDHEQLMLALGLQSKREITRTRIRVHAAMAAQTREQGRRRQHRPARPVQACDLRKRRWRSAGMEPQARPGLRQPPAAPRRLYRGRGSPPVQDGPRIARRAWTFGRGTRSGSVAARVHLTAFSMAVDRCNTVRTASATSPPAAGASPAATVRN
jgi:hypothetical protein